MNQTLWPTSPTLARYMCVVTPAATRCCQQNSDSAVYRTVTVRPVIVAARVLWERVPVCDHLRLCNWVQVRSFD